MISNISMSGGPLSSNNLEQVIYTRDAHANSAFHPSEKDNLVAISRLPAVILATKILSYCRRILRGEGNSMAGWGRSGNGAVQGHPRS